jgi:outer membrane protein
MKLQVFNGVAGALLIALCAATPAAAQAAKEAHIQDLIRAAAQRAGIEAQQSGTSTTASAPSAAPGAPRATLPLTLDEAIKLALDRNLDIAVQRLTPQTFDFALAGLHASYRPTLTSQLFQQSSTTPSTQTIAGASVGAGIDTVSTTWNGGVLQNLPWGGGSLSLAINNNRFSTTSQNTLINPTYQPNWSANFTQPLLRNFRTDITRQQLVVTGLNQDISEIQLQASIINTISNVRNAYWDYVFAIQSVQVARRSVDLAEQLVKDNQTRVEIGTMAPIDVVQAQAQSATQRQNLATAEGTRRSAELALKRLIVGGTQDPNWNANLQPTDQADFDPAPIDIDAAVRRALDSRTDLAQARKSLQMNDTTLLYLRNQTLPQVDFIARYGLTGLGGTQFTGCTGAGINRVCSGTLPGGYTDSLGSLFTNTFPTWNVALNVSFPLGTSAQDAAVARARVQSNQVEAQMRQIELQIATDVTNAAVQVENNVERVQAAQAARELSERQLDAEQSKFEVGMSTNYFVVQAQRDLATAQNNELQAVLAYRHAQVELERLQQTTLQSSNITLISAAAIGPAGGSVVTTTGPSTTTGTTTTTPGLTTTTPGR